ncbi:hypothetical protein [Paenibacillus thiaminolyticus]|uniref:Uncharacterized protein n=1 Tax=Paenibacillus thiaminolyticus TaxID=49283 RepID=A0A3A3GUL6_PANTH|nr:hypothetical protein [Paenibacillus thiaminolyticus]RJG21343.1 hypothetical protein DQX05_21820 [Paenibacillus thiaminolyticus]
MIQTIFVGALDKSDFLIYLGSLLSQTEKRVLLADATKEQWLRYHVCSQELNNNITDFYGIDIAHYITHYKQLQQLLQNRAYDYVLLDTDNENFLDPVMLQEMNARYLVTNYEKYVVERNKELFITNFLNQPEPISFNCIVLEAVDCQVDFQYLEQYYYYLPLRWGRAIEIPLDDYDKAIKINNSYNMHVRGMKRLSKKYVQALQSIANEISLEGEDIKKNWKLLLKGR